MTNPDLGLGEGYMDGGLEIENDDLRGLLDLTIRNLWAGNRNWMQRLRSRARYHLRPLGQLYQAARARRNVAHHDDLSGAL